MTDGSRLIDHVLMEPGRGGEGHAVVGTASGAWSEPATRAAQANCTILITGETGVGKGHLAQWIHANSPRRGGAFVPVNAGAIPETLIDSQLFGHVRGAFSGAMHEHIGFVRAAEGGTLFLDEVSELPPTAQTRLLRLLQEREVQPVGRARPIIVDVRILAATNRDLVRLVTERKFREDLLYRLDVLRLHVRPLRDRGDEIPGLVEAFNGEFAAMYGQPPLTFEPRAMRLLQSHPWPGNVRQLRTVLERLHVLCAGESITVAHLVEAGQLLPVEPRSGRCRIDQVKREAVKRVLSQAEGSITRAAEIFGVHRSTIYRWLAEH